jgi:hypothetical protein
MHNSCNLEARFRQWLFAQDIFVPYVRGHQRDRLINHNRDFHYGRAQAFPRKALTARGSGAPVHHSRQQKRDLENPEAAANVTSDARI